MSFIEAIGGGKHPAPTPETEKPLGEQPKGFEHRDHIEESNLHIEDSTTDQNLTSADGLVVTVSGARFATPVGKEISKAGKRYIDRPASGAAVHLSLPWADYVAQRQRMGAHTMLVCGTFEADDADGRRVAFKAKAGADGLALSNAYLAFRPGPGVLRIDFDVKRPDEVKGLWPEKPTTFASPEELAGLLTDDLVGLFPGMEGVACLAFHSTGSNISDSDGNHVSGAGGIRIEIPVADATKIPEFLEIICERSWLNGYGWAFVDEAGRTHHRGLADEALNRPHQPDYCAPHLLDGFTQDRCWYLQPGRPLVALEPLTDAEMAQVASAKRMASEALAEVAARAKAKAKGRRVDALVQKGVLRSQAADRVERLLECCELLATDEVVTVDGEVLALEDLAADRDDRGGLRDPIEPDYQGGKDVAKFFFNDGLSYVYSQAHGGRRYEIAGLVERLFNVLPPLSPEEQAEDDAIQARNQLKFDWAKRVAGAAIERARIESGGRVASLYPASVEIMKAVAAALKLESAHSVAEMIGLDHAVVEAAYRRTFWQHKESKFYMLPAAGDSLLACARSDFALFVRRMVGRLFDSAKLKRAVLDSPAARELDSDAKREKLLKEVAEIPADSLAGSIRFERQATGLRIEVDVFATSTAMSLSDGVAHITYAHKRLAEPGYEARLVADYKEHFPELDRLLAVFVAARFAASRKTAYLWMNAESDWGKSFFMDTLKKHGAVVVTTTDEIKAMYKGSPCGKSEPDFRRAFILAVDEFKGVNAEVKLLTNELTLAPKNQLTLTAPLYMKLFLSAEGAESLLSDAGIEDQFANRFTHYRAVGSLAKRPVFAESHARYFDSVYGYVGQELNRLIDRYVALGRLAAADAAQRELEAFYADYRIDRGEKRMSEKLEEHAHDFAQWVVDTYRRNPSRDGIGGYVWVTAQGQYAIQSPAKVCALWMRAAFTDAESARLGFKRAAIIEALGVTKMLKVRDPARYRPEPSPFGEPGSDKKVLVLEGFGPDKDDFDVVE